MNLAQIHLRATKESAQIHYNSLVKWIWARMWADPNNFQRVLKRWLSALNWATYYLKRTSIDKVIKS